jgi:hypothetical protein
MLERRSSKPAPMVLKVVVVIQALFVASRLLRALREGPSFGVVSGVLALAAFVALWNMKRWAVVVLGVNAIGGAVTTLPGYIAATPHSLPTALAFSLLLLVFANAALFVALPFWRQMTWR